jgi:hypothetical protein
MNESGAGREAPAGAASRGERLREELRNFAIIAFYLWICFGAVILYKSSVLRAEGINQLFPLGFAAGKALILGKFLLIGQAIRLGSRQSRLTLLQEILRRTLLAVALLVALTVVEEVLVGWVHGQAAAQTIAEFTRRSPSEIAAECLLLGLIVLPLVTLKLLSRALGPGVLRAHLRGPAPHKVG